MLFKHPRKEINKLIDGELSGEAKDNLLLHMSKCEKCREEYNTLLFLKGILSYRERIEPADYFVSKVFSGIKSTESSLTFVELIAKRAWSLVVIFSFIIFIAIGIFIYTDLSAPAEADFIKDYENLLLAENGDLAAEPSIIEVSSEDVW